MRGMGCAAGAGVEQCQYLPDQRGSVYGEADAMLKQSLVRPGSWHWCDPNQCGIWLSVRYICTLQPSDPIEGDDLRIWGARIVCAAKWPKVKDGRRSDTPKLGPPQTGSAPFRSSPGRCSSSLHVLIEWRGTRHIRASHLYTGPFYRSNQMHGGKSVVASTMVPCGRIPGRP
ncbi:hypothetical protein K461DRAFT_34959 [Myriangium duriaei CBS 260.36]|uniref:Uncharacterized protein n=1 Tax=Myriangium duriaei CBS 260.36 TaxID=1168546 RepID=A0A9P4IZT8_9PEZI|nr:hypothetical protein K461DRAFT_34959 [Myriangium duriaei CBS 260.36]